MTEIYIWCWPSNPWYAPCDASVKLGWTAVAVLLLVWALAITATLTWIKRNRRD